MSTQPNETDSATSAAQAGAALQPSAEGHFTGVNVNPIQSQPGTLRGGTGTMSAIGVFSCGPFSKQDLPQIDTFYNITGQPKLNLPGWVCVHSGPTSDFKAKK